MKVVAPGVGRVVVVNHPASSDASIACETLEKGAETYSSRGGRVRTSRTRARRFPRCAYAGGGRRALGRASPASSPAVDTLLRATGD